MKGLSPAMLDENLIDTQQHFFHRNEYGFDWVESAWLFDVDIRNDQHFVCKSNVLCRQ
jgi:predicted TIM-barrel fold metal-dependent hydrolase